MAKAAATSLPSLSTLRQIPQLLPRGREVTSTTFRWVEPPRSVLLRPRAPDPNVSLSGTTAAGTTVVVSNFLSWPLTVNFAITV